MKKWRRGKGTRQRLEPRARDHHVKGLTHVHSQFTKIGVELTRETQASSNSRHDNGDELVEIAVCGCGELQGPEADIVEGFVIDAERLVRVLNKLMYGERRVVRLISHDQMILLILTWSKY